MAKRRAYKRQCKELLERPFSKKIYDEIKDIMPKLDLRDMAIKDIYQKVKELGKTIYSIPILTV